ncbi:DUF2911 domain-containing protein [Neolewinella litorea]|uniref:DUF2911 domain-containing protein n=1 Tax=Neolewinella litorea TaxID=2562452 RepID=A0A4S4NLB3_9BACT|nr:DUF2911 domain-containing protein [Neolewinella litorea]THH39667.1 DUF2911 domain-containing protein [Neolewinella litorea]
MLITLRSLTFLVLLLFLGTCAGNEASEDGSHHHEAAPAANATAGKSKSPHTTAMGNIGNAHVHIEYSSPSVRGRTIWGGLVAYDQVWSTGAHNATAVTFSEPVRVGDTDIAAGTYGFFTIPGREEWIIILNENYDQHLADDYDQSLDLIRVTVQPEKLPEPVESLTYAVEPSADGAGGAITVAWDSLKVALPVSATE